MTDGETVDVDGTARKRAEIRHARIGREPVAELKSPASVGVSVIRRSESGPHNWACGYCGASLGSTSENWRDQATCRERPVHEAYEEYEMFIRTRVESPAVTMREYFCSSCAGTLSVDIATDGMVLRAPQLA